jgi:hypothetical protein
MTKRVRPAFSKPVGAPDQKDRFVVEERRPQIPSGHEKTASQ